MIELNKVLLVGRLTRDPEVRHTPQGTAVGKFSIAVDRRVNKERKEVSFIDCECWERQAEFLQQWFTKGKPIFVEGRLKQDSWEDRDTGQKRTKMVIVAEKLSFVGGPDRAEGEPGGDGDSGDAPAPAAAAPRRPPAQAAGASRPPQRPAPAPRPAAPAAAEDQGGRAEDYGDDNQGGPTDDDLPF